MNPTKSEDVAVLRRLGVAHLVARGWTKLRIAKATKMSVDNLRLLSRPGRGQYSEAGVRLDHFLEEQDAFSSNTKHPGRPVDRRRLTVRESPLEYTIKRDIGLPSAEQIETAMMEARQSGDEKSIATLHDLQDQVYGILEESEALQHEFLALVESLRRARLALMELDVKQEPG